MSTSTIHVMHFGTGAQSTFTGKGVAVPTLVRSRESLSMKLGMEWMPGMWKEEFQNHREKGLPMSTPLSTMERVALEEEDSVGIAI